MRVWKIETRMDLVDPFYRRILGRFGGRGNCVTHSCLPRTVVLRYYCAYFLWAFRILRATASPLCSSGLVTSAVVGMYRQGGPFLHLYCLRSIHGEGAWLHPEAYVTPTARYP